jgi:hypothetical protein
VLAFANFAKFASGWLPAGCKFHSVGRQLDANFIQLAAMDANFIQSAASRTQIASG